MCGRIRILTELPWASKPTICSEFEISECLVLTLDLVLYVASLVSFLPCFFAFKVRWLDRTGAATTMAVF